MQKRGKEEKVIAEMVKRVQYFYTEVADKPGEGARFLLLQDPPWADVARASLPTAGKGILFQGSSVKPYDASGDARDLSTRCVT